MNIEQLAAQVGFLPADWQLLGKHLERFAALVLEEAAKVCEAEHLEAPTNEADDIAYDHAVNDCAAAIRALAAQKV